MITHSKTKLFWTIHLGLSTRKNNLWWERLIWVVAQMTAKWFKIRLQAKFSWRWYMHAHSISQQPCDDFSPVEFCCSHTRSCTCIITTRYKRQRSIPVHHPLVPTPCMLSVFHANKCHAHWWMQQKWAFNEHQTKDLRSMSHKFLITNTHFLMYFP